MKMWKCENNLKMGGCESGEMGECGNTKPGFIL